MSAEREEYGELLRRISKPTTHSIYIPQIYFPTESTASVFPSPRTGESRVTSHPAKGGVNYVPSSRRAVSSGQILLILAGESTKKLGRGRSELTLTCRFIPPPLLRRRALQGEHRVTWRQWC